MKYLIISGFDEFYDYDKLPKEDKKWHWDNAHEYNTDTIDDAIEEFSKNFDIDDNLIEYGSEGVPIIVRSEHNAEYRYNIGAETFVSYWSNEVK